MTKILIDKPAGVIHDLDAIIEDALEKGREDMDKDDVEIFIGRNEGNTIQLGANSKNHTTRTQNVRIKGTSNLSTVSGLHARIRFRYRGEKGFYVKDLVSTNGTRINDYRLSLGEEALIKNRTELLFGAYGPMIYEDTEESHQEALWEYREREESSESSN